MHVGMIWRSGDDGLVPTIRAFGSFLRVARDLSRAAAGKIAAVFAAVVARRAAPYTGPMISRREFLGGVATMTAAAAPARYNVIVLMSDEHNPFFSQPYGHRFVSTPNMTRLARMG